MTNGKKSFKDEINPANFFITPEDAPEPEAADEAQIPLEVLVERWHNRKRNRPTVEPRSRRVNVLLRPSLYDQAKQIAEAQGESVNSFIHAAVEERVRRILTDLPEEKNE